MVNSSWTEKHILDLWNIPFRTHRVYPPCEVSHLKNIEHIESDKIIIVSVGQFRPEKDHPLQLQAMYELRTKLQNNEPLWEKVWTLFACSFQLKSTQHSSFNFFGVSVETGDYWILS